MTRLDGKVAIVTGAARGLGESIARAIVAAGARVLITDIDDARGSALAAELGPGAVYRRLDVTRRDDWAAAVAAAETALGPVTVLVANAPRMEMGSFDDMTEEEFTSVWRVNELGCFLGMKATVESMRKAGGGSIVNICSVAGMHPSGGLAYSASKWAMRGMTKSAARELGRENIRVNAVLPGWMRGPSSEGIDLERVAAVLPLRRVGNTDKIAQLVVFLASDDAEFVTGSDYVIDGGAMLMGSFEVIDLLAGRGIGDLPASALLPTDR